MKKIIKKKFGSKLRGPSVLFNCFSSKLLQIKGFLVIFDPLEWTKKNFCHFFFKYKAYTLFWYLVYENRIKIEKTVLFYFLYFFIVSVHQNLRIIQK